MSTENSNVFKKENLDLYLKELAKEYKKLVGKSVPAEIILIGGAAIVENYGFRDMTTDVDAIVNAASAMKDAINRVGDLYSLPNGWLNSDFKRTESYSEKLVRFSLFYKTFNQVLNVRIVTGEYLIAMKLRAFRRYKNDLSDVIGVLAEHKERGDEITFERVKKAVEDLYGSMDCLPDGARDFIGNAILEGNYAQAYDLVRQNEKEAREQTVVVREERPDDSKTESVEDILKKLRKKKPSDTH